MSVNCMDCGGDIEVPADAMQGEILPCAACGAEMEVLTLEPVTVGAAPLVQEDWGE